MQQFSHVKKTLGFVCYAPSSASSPMKGCYELCSALLIFCYTYMCSMMLMHCKLFFFKRVVAFSPCNCCFLLLLILCGVSVHGDADSTDSCSSSFMKCANLGSISFPFWGSAACAASPSYVLSNCSSPSSKQVYWDSFSSAATGVSHPPVVTSVAGTSIQLSWNNSLIELGICAPLFSSKNLSLYNIPSSINLTRFNSDSFALEFSPNTIFLLFNCTHSSNASKVVAQLGPQDFVTESASGCKPYKGLCRTLAKMPCIQWSAHQSLEVLMLQQVLDSLSCAHFMLGIASHMTKSGPFEDAWSTGSIELVWRDLQCKKCTEEAFGNCSYDVIFPEKFDQCVCNGNTLDFDTGTYNCYGPGGHCTGGPLHCSTGAKVAVGVSVTIGVLGIIALGIKLAIRYKSRLQKLYGIIRDYTRDAFISFTKVTIPIAIGVLKSALRKLQSFSFIPSNFLDDMDFDELTERPVEYSYGTISSATKSFTSLVGEGGFSSVYKGTLTQASSHGGSESQIAVKVLEVKSKHSKTQFLNEVITIGRIHHVNVVRLLGFCVQADHEILVYEYVVNGSLDSWLFAEKANAKDKILDWGKRYAIALGVARGLSYLHEECRHRTVHCDIKPQNILLDENMHPKIADFGLARLMGRDESKVMTFAKGTPGYMAPEFWMGGESQLSTKFDVYSYGMVLLELISGRRNFSHDAMSSSRYSFPTMAFKAAMEQNLQSILDSRLSISMKDGDEAQIQAHWNQIKTTVLVALWCIQDHPTSRPYMSEVVKYLEGGAVVSNCPPLPNISTFYGPSRTPQESSIYNDENDSAATSA